MSPKVVSKTTYYFWSILFYSLCLSGLIWQVTQISINFFKFEVVKDINVITPDVMNLNDRSDENVIYICFHNKDILNNKVYENYEIEYLKQNPKTPFDSTGLRVKIATYHPLEDRFKMTQKWERLGRVDSVIGEFIKGNKYCYMPQIRSLQLRKNLFEGFTIFQTALGNKLSSFDERRLLDTYISDMSERNSSELLQIKSYKYFIKELEWPYTDNCLEYQNSNFGDKNNAIASCSERITGKTPEKGFVSHSRTAWREKYENSSLRISHVEYRERSFEKVDADCVERNFKEECLQRLYLTQIVNRKVTVSTGKSELIIAVLPDLDASYNVISKPKIDNIDYVTYILGAMGSWIGFSFIGINPIPHLIKKQSSAVDVASCNHSHLEKYDNHITKSNRGIYSDKITHVVIRANNKTVRTEIRSNTTISNCNDT